MWQQHYEKGERVLYIPITREHNVHESRAKTMQKRDFPLKSNLSEEA
jgi:hypothetical protein